MRKVITKIIPAAVGSAAGKGSLGKGLIGAGLGLVAARIARRSLPGAVFVGGAMVAKWLYDKKQEEKAAEAAAAAMGAPIDPPPDAPVVPSVPPQP
ncbi:MAG: hypothetical protein SFV20_05035 [Sphingopyxis sp.]|nr:hypothetical protein [Sphingopyxis sp.]